MLVIKLQSDVHAALRALHAEVSSSSNGVGVAAVATDDERPASARCAPSESRFERVSVPKSLMGAATSTAQQTVATEEVEEHEL